MVMGIVVSTFFAGTVISPELNVHVWSPLSVALALGTVMLWLSKENVTSDAPVSMSLTTATIWYFWPML